MARAFTGAVVAALLVSSWAAGAAEDDARTRRQQSLDEQVQQLKEEVLRIDQELQRLEERLVYPSSSQMALFLSIEPTEEFSLDSVDVRLDDSRFTSHVYEYRELQALLDGGVQRLRVANVTSGPHRLEVTIRGVSADDIDYDVSDSFEFDKAAGPRLIELRVVDTGSRRPGLEIVSRQ
ncbi:MAG: hypothetical protein U5K43_15670 [Halofilum sp. (in: g-proteobacteria)]|nr:hypothetical protein [Halofilum sp. (in: g-proteobacteria)]